MANFRYREQLDYLYSVSVGVVIQVLALTGTLGPVLWPSPSPLNLAIFYSLFNPSPPVKTGSGRFCGNLKVNFSWPSQKYKNRLVELRYSESVSSLLNRLFELALYPSESQCSTAGFHNQRKVASTASGLLISEDEARRACKARWWWRGWQRVRWLWWNFNLNWIMNCKVGSGSEASQWIQSCGYR